VDAGWMVSALLCAVILFFAGYMLGYSDGRHS
jgi:hypothetical protein